MTSKSRHEKYEITKHTKKSYIVFVSFVRS